MRHRAVFLAMLGLATVLATTGRAQTESNHSGKSRTNLADLLLGDGHPTCPLAEAALRHGERSIRKGLACPACAPYRRSI